jgi:hypothetical protein
VRQLIGTQTLFVKVHDHNANTLHKLDDTLVVDGDEAEEEVLLNISQRGLHVSDIAVHTTWTEQWVRQEQRFVNQKIANET